MNLGGISSTLFESEMFGHVRGAFTDARHDRKGRFEMANGGTIFLDEIGELDPASQVKLLRVLQDRTYEVLGSSQRRTVDVRVVAATNRNLGGDGRPRRVPRRPALPHQPDRRAPAAAARAPRRHPAAGPPLPAGGGAGVSSRGRRASAPTALAWLKDQPWPGNVRQLRQGIERAVLVTDKPVLDAADFQLTAEMEPREAERDVLPPVGSMTMDEIEKAMIVKSLKHHNGNISRVAEALGLSRAALYRRFEKYEIAV